MTFVEFVNFRYIRPNTGSDDYVNYTTICVTESLQNYFKISEIITII